MYQLVLRHLCNIVVNSFCRFATYIKTPLTAWLFKQFSLCKKGGNKALTRSKLRPFIFFVESLKERDTSRFKIIFGYICFSRRIKNNIFKINISKLCYSDIGYSFLKLTMNSISSFEARLWAAKPLLPCFKVESIPFSFKNLDRRISCLLE